MVFKSHGTVSRSLELGKNYSVWIKNVFCMHRPQYIYLNKTRYK